MKLTATLVAQLLLIAAVIFTGPCNGKANVQTLPNGATEFSLTWGKKTK
jgi:hypothetical protein